MNYYLDTEFDENGKTIELISLGLVCEDGREYYAVSSDFDPSKCNDWVKKNVLTHLPPSSQWVPRHEIRHGIQQIIGSDPQPVIWAYFADYDWVVFCQLFGAMVDLPSSYPNLCMDLKQLAIHKQIRGRIKNHVPQKTTRHDALEDARWNKQLHEWLLAQPQVVL